MLWQLRTPLPSDESFIYSSWLESYRDSPAVRGVSNTSYYKAMHAIIEGALKNGAVLIASSEEDPDLIYGYVSFTIGAINYIYVKHAFRGFGVGKALEAAALTGQALPISYPLKTRVGERLLRTRPQYRHDPFTLLGAKQ